ncbi:MAG: PD40 domain-containing protein [Muribaculaceae bacterium]|nr:PD40 domain-containing protein [Muribaculaceae bacterium]MBR1727734.1 PD40 domain-containing protein [Muribaculaceae bacterium]
MRKTTATVLLASLMAAAAINTQAGEARLMRFPATNGSEVTFSYAGDLYRVSIHGGVAQRLTSHDGYEAFARYSPDGRQLAFTGQYDGNTEVYVMPSEGGTPRRITYTASNPRDDWGDRMGPNNIAMTWTPDGRGILYRNRISDSFTGQLWCAPVDGGMAQQLPLPEGGFCSYSPDGQKLAYNRVMREFRTWKYYRGGMADDIWIWDTQAQQVTNVTNNVGQDIIPMWIGDEIYYISDRDKTMNIFVYNTATGATSKVTHYDDYDVKFPSCGGGIIVFEKGGYLYKLDPKTKQASQIVVELNDEGGWARTALRQVKDFVTAAQLAPDGNRLVVTARGEVFDLPVKKGVTRNLTHTPGAHEREGKWSPDGKWIAYISDITGETELWLRPADGGDPIQLTRDNDTYIRDFEWSPKGESIVYTDRENRIVLVSVASKSKVTLVQDSIGEFPTPSFSPDGRWLAYSQTTSNELSVIYLYDIAARKAHQVTENWYDSNSPKFSSDGKYLIFASGRDFNPIYSSVEWNFAYRNMEGIYLMMLAQDTPSPFLPTDDQVSTGKDEQKPTDASSDKKNAKGKKADTAPAMKVDLDGIASRVVKLPLSGGNYGGFACDGQHVWYYGGGGTHVYDLKEQKDELIAAGAMMQPSADMKKAVWFKGGDVYVTDLTPRKAELTEVVNLDDMMADVDYEQEWKQIFNEAWRAYRDGFYLKNMHGVDWNAIHDKYAALLPWVKNRLDLTYVIGGMIGELACGHAYVDGGDHITPDQQRIGMLGAQLERDGKSFKITKILKGAPEREELRSPLLEPGMNVKEGDYIVAVDGVKTDGVDNIYTLLRGKADVMTELTVASSASGAGARKVVVKPLQDEYPLYHYEWVQHNIAYVNEKTGGRVGYIYIPDMGPEGLKEFARYFFPQLDKEALIVDDRGNGGGNISPMIIERLLRKPYRMTMYRGSNHNGLIPEATLNGPKVLLVNKYSASDGDLFPWSFKENKIGTLIGTRSWGGIIGISGSLPYMDGTDIRVPFFTNYDTRGNWIVENHGVDPDIVIDNDPLLEYKGIDQQLDKAIEVILEQLKDRKPLPKTPAPRTLHDLGVD